MHKNKQAGFSAILVLILVVLALGAFFYLKTNKETSPNNLTEFSTPSSKILETKIHYQSDINNISFYYPSCLGEVIPDKYSNSEYGEVLRFSKPENCISGLSFGSITFGRKGIDRGGIIAGIEHFVVNREQFPNKNGKNFAIVTYGLPSYPDHYLVESFYVEDGSELDEKSSFIVMMRYNRYVDDELSPFKQTELNQVKDFFKSVMETVSIN